MTMLSKWIQIRSLFSLQKTKSIPIAQFVEILIGKISLQTVQAASFCLLEYAGIPNLRARGPGAVRRGEPSDIDSMEILEGAGKERIFLERFSRGDYCVVAVQDGKLLGYEWYTSKSPHCEDRYLYPVSFPEDAVFTYDAFILPKYRVSGIWIRFQWFIGEHMRAMGKKRVVTLIDRYNALSINTHLRFGFHIYRRILYLKLAGKRFFRERDLARPEPVSRAAV